MKPGKVRVQSYSAVMAGKFPEAWPGCRNGLHMPCGRVHDFGDWVYVGPNQREWEPKVVCLTNHQFGCPRPQPEPEKMPAWR